MNMNRMIAMLVRMFLRPLISRGINKGISRMGGKGASGTTVPGANARSREVAKRARQAAKITRRIGRM